MKYPVILCKELDGYLVNVPDLPGCQVKGKTVDSAIDKITDAIAAHLTILAEYSEKIPHASLIEKLQTEIQTKNIGENKTSLWAIVNIDITPYLGKSHKINVTLPELLIKQIDDRVSKHAEYKTRSGFIAHACMTELKK